MIDIKVVSTEIGFREIPEEVSLLISISGCPLKCPGCHSPELHSNDGELLTPSLLQSLIDRYNEVTCVCFLGINYIDANVEELIKVCRKNYKKVGIYTGYKSLELRLESFVDYIKLGPYIKELGPLNAKKTNQKLFKITDITNKVK